MLARPLANVLELVEHGLGRDEVLLVEDEHRLAVDAPRIRLRLLLPSLRPDRLTALGYAEDANIGEVTRAMPPNACTPVT